MILVTVKSPHVTVPTSVPFSWNADQNPDQGYADQDQHSQPLLPLQGTQHHLASRGAAETL